LGYPDAELSLSLVDDLQIGRLNQQYRNRARPTDVLAFPMREGECTEVNPYLLGDVVISLDTAQRQAASRGYSFEEELSFLLIHGILHLVGYDHENPGSEARRMRKKEKALFLHIKEKFLEL
jgi:probable rRNA maturation factor